jgi:phospholipid/cholesterol/gamma-HCH transport system substrate-binding protein
VAFCVSVVMMGGERWFFGSSTNYKLEFSNVQGLVKGSVVSYGGINIGNVKSISLSPNQRISIEVSIDSSWASQITTQTIGEIKTQGALGDKYIMLSQSAVDSTEPATVLPANSTIKVKTEKDFFDMLASRGNESERIFDILNEVYTLTQSINKNNKVEAIMSNLLEASSQFKQTSQTANKMVTDLSKTSQPELQKSMVSLNRILDKVDRGEGTLGALVNDPSLHQSLKSFFGDNERNQKLKSIMRSSVQNEK